MDGFPCLTPRFCQRLALRYYTRLPHPAPRAFPRATYLPHGYPLPLQLPARFLHTFTTWLPSRILPARRIRTTAVAAATFTAFSAAWTVAARWFAAATPVTTRGCTHRLAALLRYVVRSATFTPPCRGSVRVYALVYTAAHFAVNGFNAAYNARTFALCRFTRGSSPAVYYHAVELVAYALLPHATPPPLPLLHRIAFIPAY